MSETRVFRRDMVAPSFVFHAVAGMLVLNGIAHLVDRHWLWATVDLAASALAWGDLLWSRRTPIAIIDGNELVVQLHLLSRPRHVPLDTIASIDDSQPGSARLVLRSGQVISIPLHWLAWADRAPFLAHLQSVVARGVL